MSTLRVRGVPDHVRRILEAQAGAAGMSVSAYARGELSRLAHQPTLGELTERVRGRGGSAPTPAADILRALRDDKS